MDGFKETQLEQLKSDFVKRCSREKREDCFLEISSSLEIQPEESWLEKKLTEEDIKYFIENFNQEKSFLFGFEVQREKLSNIEFKTVFYSLPEKVFPEYDGLFYPIIVRLEYMVANLSDSKSKPPFYFYPKITLLQDFDGCLEEVKGKKYEDYAELLLLKFERIYDNKKDGGYLDSAGAKSIEYLYQIRHNDHKGTNVYNEMTLKKESGKYQAVMLMKTEKHETKEQAIEQLGRWSKRLGRGFEIATIKND